MGLYDRDYFRQPAQREAFARPPIMSITMWIITICVAVFVLDKISLKRPYVLRFEGTPYELNPMMVPPMSWWEYWFHFSAYTVTRLHQYWRYVSFQFLHASLPHLLFNMFALYMFGPLIESYLGRRRFLAFYLICGASGAAAYLILWQLGILHGLSIPDIGDISPILPLVGASAGIFGVLVAAAMVAPNTTIMLLFPPIPMQLRTFAWVLIGIAVFTVFTAGHNAGGEAAHLGGAAMGAALMSNPRILNIFDPSMWKRSRSAPW